jgi:hypothetical protein
MAMVEFDETLSKRFTGSNAVSQRVLYRLKPRKGEIPYFDGGLEVDEFTYSSDLLSSIRYLLRDFQVQVNVVGDRVVVGDIAVELLGDMR